MSQIIDPRQPTGAPQSDPGMSRTKSGLLVPDGTVELKRRVVTNDDWKLWRRAFKNMFGQGLRALLTCAECEDILKPEAESRTLVCKCSQWHLPTPTSPPKSRR